MNGRFEIIGERAPFKNGALSSEDIFSFRCRARFALGL